MCPEENVIPTDSKGKSGTDECLRMRNGVGFCGKVSLRPQIRLVSPFTVLFSLPPLQNRAIKRWANVDLLSKGPANE
jgi:hypothetical protein